VRADRRQPLDHVLQVLGRKPHGLPSSEADQRLAHELADRPQVVAALLDDDGRKTERPEQPPGLAKGRGG
jgi:hypothetical protein